MRTEKHIIKNRYSTHGIHRDIPVYEMNTVHCSASPMEGYKGTEVTLIDNAAWNEKFSAWALTGATATGNNIMLNNDVTAQGIYETAKNVTLLTDGNGTIYSTKMSGFIGDQATLSNIPDATHTFSGYTITGATLTGSNFNFIGNDITAKAWFNYFNTPLYTASNIIDGESPNIYLSGKTDYVVVKFDELMLTDSYSGIQPALNAFRISAMNTIMSFNITPTMEGCNWPGTGVWPDLGKYHKFIGGTTEAFTYCDNFRNDAVTAVTSGSQHTLEYVPNETVAVKFIVNLNRLQKIEKSLYAVPNMSAFIPSYTTLPIATYSLGSCEIRSSSYEYFKRVRIDGASAVKSNLFNMLNYSVSTADTLEHALAI